METTTRKKNQSKSRRSQKTNKGFREVSKVEAGRSPHQLATKITILRKKMIMRGTHLSFAAQKEMKKKIEK